MSKSVRGLRCRASSRGALLSALVGCLGGLVLAGPVAHSAMSPAVYRQARQDASYHVQVEIKSMRAPSETPGPCRIEGTIVRIFRDVPHKLKRGAAIAFNIPCTRKGDRIMAGGTLWTDFDALKAARFVEAYLGDFDRGLDVVLSQSQIIAGPSDTPQYPVGPPE